MVVSAVEGIDLFHREGRFILGGFLAPRQARLPLPDHRSVASSKSASCSGCTLTARIIGYPGSGRHGNRLLKRDDGTAFRRNQKVASTGHGKGPLQKNERQSPRDSFEG